MRIALVHPFSWPRTRRGGERYLHDLGWYLAGAGHDVAIITGTDRSDERLDEVIDGCPVHRAWVRPGHRVRRLPGIAQRFVERRRIRGALDDDWDVVHAMWPAAAEAAAVAGHRVVYTLLGMITAETRDEDPALVDSIRRAAEAVDVRAAFSTDAARHAGEVVGGDWIPLAPGLRSASFPLHDRPRTGPPRFLFCGALNVPYKGLPDVLQAFATVQDQRPDASLVLVGPGDPAWAVETLPAATRDRVGAGLVVEPPRDEAGLTELYADASALVLPSRNEAFGLVVVEALATGTPVVSSDHGGPGEILDAPGVGARVPHGDPGALAEAMLATAETAADPATPRRCADRAARWDWSSVGPVHERLYRAVADGDPVDASTAVP